jgi:NAD(P)-dependent dehydrogenase (short-subunit alcohol dehydrogenase family)
VRICRLKPAFRHSIAWGGELDAARPWLGGFVNFMGAAILLRYLANMKLEHRIGLVTGGTKGIGGATAIALAEQGADLAIVGRHADAEAEETRRRIEALGRRCLLILADVAVAREATRCVEETAKELGPVDVLVHAAGGPVNGGLFELTPEAWASAFEAHVHAVFHLCRAAIPAMRQRKEGAIILISSAAGIRGIKTNVAYQAVKGALPQLTRALAYEFANDNIRVNCVAPGVIRTAFHAAMPATVKQNNLEHRIPLHREGTPEQVASLIRELVTNDYITGETVAVDGGLTMRIC